jgi:hypothetical protein
MGRGRQKAKQAKVARELKYSSPPTDLAALQRELSVPSAADPLRYRPLDGEPEGDAAHGTEVMD